MSEDEVRAELDQAARELYAEMKADAKRIVENQGGELRSRQVQAGIWVSASRLATVFTCLAELDERLTKLEKGGGAPAGES